VALIKFSILFRSSKVSKTMKELDLRWKKDMPIKMDNHRLPQFEITSIVDSICTESFHIGELETRLELTYMKLSETGSD